MQYRKKPVVIEAWKIPPDDASGNAETAPAWVIASILRGDIEPLSGGGVSIRTLEGQMRGLVGEWIIKGVRGEVYPCKPDIFAATYDEVTPAQRISEQPTKEGK